MSATPLQLLSASRLVPVIVIDDDNHAEPLAHALNSGGITAMEITLRTPAGLASINRLARNTDQIVGAGSVLTAGQVDEAADAGARFIVSPGFSPEVVRRSQELHLTVLPGIATPSELQAAAALDISAVKLFPSELLGGLKMVDAMLGPFPHMQFMPSGGITADNASAYLRHPAVFAIGGSWMVSRQLIRDEQFSTIQSLSSLAMKRADETSPA
jgi:2-dehydro-3-deoxyphosphogluconate aldolase/(4S)-4-hydroxy-2-oxoglutarate aldolase